jgi:hypothetical protein
VREKMVEALSQDVRVVKIRLAGELSEEFLLVHVILEGFAAVNENYRNFIVELAAEFMVGVDVDFVPGETSAAG